MITYHDDDMRLPLEANEPIPYRYSVCAEGTPILRSTLSVSLLRLTNTFQYINVGF